MKHLLLIAAYTLTFSSAFAVGDEIFEVPKPTILAAYTDPPNLFEGYGETTPYVPKSPPWYDSVLGSSFGRLMIFVAIVAGLKSLFGKKKPSKPAASQNPTARQVSPLPDQAPPPPRKQPEDPPPPPSSPTQISPSTAPQGTWLYRSNENELGPFDESALRQLCKAGVIAPSFQIRRAGGGNWIIYSDVFGDN